MANLCVLQEFETEDLDLALALFGGGRLDARDAVDAATAINRGIELIVSPDRAFDHVLELERVDPSVAADVLLT